MIKLRVLKTNSNEFELLFRLVQRGRLADQCDHYYSVDDYDLENGWVMFTLLQCAPPPYFRVGVAGNCILVSDRNEKEVRSWLDDWKIKFHRKWRIIPAESSEEALSILAEMRRCAMPESERKRKLVMLLEKIRIENEKRDDAMLKSI